MQKHKMDNNITTRQSPVTIRPAQEADAQAFRNLRLEALHNHPEAFSADYNINCGHPSTFWAERLQSLGSEGMIYFAIHNDELIGMCGIRRGDSPKTRHSATIWGVYVQSEWRGLQTAESLITQCAEWARAQEIKIIKLGVISTNAAAIRCYARCDFKVYGIEPQAIFHNGTMYDELLMARNI
jgi:RimJ/RimL family protein N-acetyltransferase